MAGPAAPVPSGGRAPNEPVRASNTAERRQYLGLRGHRTRIGSLLRLRALDFDDERREGGPDGRLPWAGQRLSDPAERSCVVDLKLEVVVVPVSDVDRAKASTSRWGGASTPISR